VRITAALIVKNEAECLGECLERIASAVDEIVVVDTGSTDQTIAVARRFAHAVHQFAWVDDFAAARNASLAHVTGDYVLVVDADERLQSPGLARNRLDAFIAGHPDTALGSVAIESTIASPGGKQTVVQTPSRFFKHGAYCFEGAIHEQLVPTAGHGIVAPTGLRFDHPGYDHAPDSPQHKGHRNKRLLTAYLKAHPDHEYYLYQLGKAHFSLGEYAEAVHALEGALDIIRFDGAQTPAGHDGKGIAQGVLTDLVVSLAYAYANTNRLQQARDLLERHKALGHPGTQMADFPHALGYAYLMLGDIPRAKAGYQASLPLATLEQVQGTGSYSSEYHLGLLCEAEQDLAQAMEHYARGLRARPAYHQVLARCIDLIVEQGIVPPAAIWDLCDQQSFARVYAERFAALGAEGQARLVRAAEQVSPELLDACTRVARLKS
jgi:glycosyltransferase involved in cell wall biosynthesis